jgi:hypothetical protein
LEKTRKFISFVWALFANAMVSFSTTLGDNIGSIRRIEKQPAFAPSGAVGDHS